jgi:two-component system phosphate regulon sensor histidine kinase PhoR
MNLVRQLTLGFFLLAVGVTVGTGWLALREAHDGGLVTFAAITAGIMLGAAAWQLFVVQRERREHLVARRFLEQLLHQAEAGSGIAPNDSYPRIHDASPWKKPLERTFEYFSTSQDRKLVLESAKASAEIRLQRASSQVEWMESVLANIGLPVLALNAYDEIVLANPDAETLLKIRAEGTERRSLPRVIGNDRLTNLIYDVRRRAVATVRTDDLELEDNAGHRRWYRATVGKLPSTDKGPDSGGALVVLRDVSVEHSMQKQHAEFVSSASHEMKAPLAGIKAYVELLADGDAESEAEREEFLGVINSQTDRLQRLIDNLLNIARIEAGVVKVSKQSRSINDILAEAAGVVQPTAEAKRIQLVSDLSPLYLGALVDRDMMSQAVINLLSNAVKYTPDGGRVTLRSRLADQELLIEVEDTGVGLSKEDCVKIFEKFYRVDKDKNMATGTGLGLALAQHIVEDVHGGKLTVRSKLGVGSTFCISIPHVARAS